MGTVRVIVLLLFALPAYATDKPQTPAEPLQATASSAADADATATQGQTQQQGQQQTASNDLTIGGDRNLALVNGSATSPVCPVGLVPGKRLKRSVASPVFSMSAVCVPPNEAEAAAMRVQLDHEIKLAEIAAGLERERLAIERDRVKLESLRLSECHQCEALK